MTKQTPAPGSEPAATATDQPVPPSRLTAAARRELISRAIAAYCRSPAWQPPNRCDVREHDGKRYVVLSARGQVLAVYRVRPAGILKGLKQWPAELETEK